MVPHDGIVHPPDLAHLDTGGAVEAGKMPHIATMSSPAGVSGSRAGFGLGFYRLLDGVVIDDADVFNEKLQWEHFYNYATQAYIRHGISGRLPLGDGSGQLARF